MRALCLLSLFILALIWWWPKTELTTDSCTPTSEPISELSDSMDAPIESVETLAPYEELLTLSPSNARLVTQLREDGRLTLELGHVKREIVPAPARVFSPEALIHLGDGTPLLHPERHVHVFAGSVAATSHSPTTLTPADPLTFVERFDASSANLTAIGDQLVFSLRNAHRDRVLIRQHPLTSALEMRYEPNAQHQNHFGSCEANACEANYPHQVNPHTAALVAAAQPTLTVPTSQQQQYDEWLPLTGASLEPSRQAIETSPGSDAATGQKFFRAVPPPFGPKYQDTLRQMTYITETGPDLLADPDNPTAADIGSMLCRLLLSIEEVNEIYERNTAVEMHIAELVVRTNDTTGELGINDIKNNRGGSWVHLAHGRIYGWGGGGYAAGSYFNISSWPVGIAHELGHILGLSLIHI